MKTDDSAFNLKPDFFLSLHFFWSLHCSELAFFLSLHFSDLAFFLELAFCLSLLNRHYVEEDDYEMLAADIDMLHFRVLRWQKGQNGEGVRFSEGEGVQDE